MATLTLPEVNIGVYNRLPYLVNPDEDTLIDNFTAELLLMFQNPLDIDDADALDIENYPKCVKALMPDLVAMYMVMRQSVIGTEGDGTATGGLARYLKRAKAGEAETEWDLAKPEEAARFVTSAQDLIDRFRKQAQMKATNCNIELIFDGNTLFCITCHTSNPTLTVTDWDDE